MRQSIIEAFPKADIGILVVWIDVLGSDNEQTALRATERMGKDPRVRYFHDPNRLTGVAFMKSLPALKKGEHLAWDIYLYYQPSDEWTGATPPRAQAYLHQLAGRGLAFEHRGDALIEALKQTMADMLATQH